MCGRFTMLTWEEVAQVVANVTAGRAARTLPIARHAEAFPGSEAPVIVAGADALEPRQLCWGFTLPDTGKLVFNTRLESAAGSPFWGEAFKQRRCIVPAWEFCETHRTQMAIGETGRPVRQAYRFTRDDGDCMLMAGVWQDNRFSVITTEPDDAVSPVHDRMPLLLSSSRALDWVAGAEPGQDETALLKAAVYPTAQDAGEQLGLF